MRNWDDMRVFLAVARHGSLSGAAPVLRMDAATVGRRIARLEDAAGAALFMKSPQGYALTDLGARMQRHTEDAEAAMTRVQEEARGDQSELTGQIRIGAPDGAANYLLPQVCAAIRQENPGLELQILALPRVVNLSQREADMALAVSRPQTGRLILQKISDYRLHLAARTDIAASIRSRNDLRSHPIVGYIPDMIFDKELDYLGPLAEEGVQVASNSVVVQTMALRAGAGVGIVHDFALPFAPDLRRVLVQDVALTRSFYLVRHASGRSSDRLTRVANAIVDGLRREIARLEARVDAQDGPHVRSLSRP